MKSTVTLQELAKFMRDAAYSDGQSHFIDCSLHVVHPVTDDGVVGFSGSMFNRNRSTIYEGELDRYDINVKKNVSIAFSYDERNGISNFNVWVNGDLVRFICGSKPTFTEFKFVVTDMFDIKKLFDEE